jgi:hypothetical protein
MIAWALMNALLASEVARSGEVHELHLGKGPTEQTCISNREPSSHSEDGLILENPMTASRFSMHLTTARWSLWCGRSMTFPLRWR